jgi:transcriptional regulator with PAS, ATPase and Fis domain
MEELNILLKEILKGNEEFIFVLHPQKGLIFHNEKQNLLGYDKNQFEKLKISQLLNKNSLETILQLFKEDKHTKKVLEITLIKKNKSEVPIRATIKPFIHQKQVLLIIRADEDITEVIDILNVDPKNYWKNIFDSLPEYISICDKKFNITYINRSNYGEKSALIGMNILDYGN